MSLVLSVVLWTKWEQAHCGHNCNGGDILELECTPPLQLCPQWVCSHFVCNGIVYLSERVTPWLYNPFAYINIKGECSKVSTSLPEAESKGLQFLTPLLDQFGLLSPHPHPYLWNDWEDVLWWFHWIEFFTWNPSNWISMKNVVYSFLVIYFNFHTIWK